MWSTDDTTILRARARVAGITPADAAALRRRMASMLAGLRLRPAGMPPSAVLFVRRLADPAPGLLGLRGHRPNAAWERALERELDRAARTATRPMRGMIPGDPDAVLFADEGECLAALSLDLARGQAAARWWWRAPLRSAVADDPRPIVALLAGRIRWLPAALRYAAAWGADREIVAALPAHDAHALLVMLADEYGIDRGAIPAFAADRRRPAAPGHRDVEPHADSPADAPVVRPPWEIGMLLSRRDDALSPSGRLLLGVALAIGRDPAAARAPAFAAAVRAWWSAELVADHRAAPAGDGAPRADDVEALHPASAAVHDAARPIAAAQSDADTRPADEAQVVDDARRPEARLPEEARTMDPWRSEDEARPPADATRDAAATHDRRAGGSRATRPGDEPDARDDGAAVADASARAAEPGATSHDGIPPAGEDGPQIPPQYRTAAGPDDPGGAVDRERLDHAGAAGAAFDDGPAAAANAGTATFDRDAVAVEVDATEASGDPNDDAYDFGQGLSGAVTGLVGVFYLLNLYCHLDLVTAIEEACDLRGRLGPWEMLEALARTLLAAQGEEGGNAMHVDDALWQILSSLDDRPTGALAGHAVERVSRFRLPPVWHADMGAGEYRWAAENGRLRLWCDVSRHAAEPVDDRPHESPGSQQRPLEPSKPGAPASTARYLLVDIPRDAGPAHEQAARECAVYAAANASQFPGLLLSGSFEEAPGGERPNGATIVGVHGPEGGMTAVLAMLLPYVLARLAPALGRTVEDRSWITMLLAVPGRVHASATHVDVMIGMNDIAMPVRMAGLDRDPGWLPEFGRVVQFHFD